MNIKPMDDASFNPDNLDEGIRRTVVWLREHGFRTTDSGDGESKLALGLTEDDGIIPFPHVAMVVAPPDNLVAEAKRLHELLWDEHNIDIQPEGPEPDAAIQASYCPATERAVIVLSRVDDSMLTPPPPSSPL